MLPKQRRRVPPKFFDAVHRDDLALDIAGRQFGLDVSNQPLVFCTWPAAGKFKRFNLSCSGVKDLPRSFANAFAVVTAFGDAAAGIVERPLAAAAIVIVLAFGPELAVWMPGASRAVALRNILG